MVSSLGWSENGINTIEYITTENITVSFVEVQGQRGDLQLFISEADCVHMYNAIAKKM